MRHIDYHQKLQLGSRTMGRLGFENTAEAMRNISYQTQPTMFDLLFPEINEELGYASSDREQ